MNGGIRGAHSRCSVFSLILPIMSYQPSKVNSSEACLLGTLSPKAPVVSPQERLCQDLPAARGGGRAGTAGRAKNRACLGRRAFEPYLSPKWAEVVSIRGPGLRQAAPPPCPSPFPQYIQGSHSEAAKENFPLLVSQLSGHLLHG